MLNKNLIIVDKLEDIVDYKKAGVTAFVFALKDYSVGYPNTYNYEDIIAIDGNKYLLINRLLDCTAVESLREILVSQMNIKGIIYEDLAVYQIVHKNNLPYELIYFQNHFQTNQKAVSYWLNHGVDSLVIANELTFEEIQKLSDRFPNKLIIQVFGHNQIMYSRRLLLNNYFKKFNLMPKNEGILKEPITGIEFIAWENEYGTVLYSPKVFNGAKLIKNTEPYYFLINSVFVNHQDIISFLTEQESFLAEQDEGFLNTETIYRLKERSNDE